VNLTSGSIDSAKKEGKGAEEEKERNCIRQRKPVFCHVQLSFFMASFFGTVIQPMYRTSPRWRMNYFTLRPLSIVIAMQLEKSSTFGVFKDLILHYCVHEFGCIIIAKII
jgi:hypothetical protein